MGLGQILTKKFSWMTLMFLLEHVVTFGDEVNEVDSSMQAFDCYVNVFHPPLINGNLQLRTFSSLKKC